MSYTVRCLLNKNFFYLTLPDTNNYTNTNNYYGVSHMSLFQDIYLFF